jgi:hypothetical protein
MCTICKPILTDFAIEHTELMCPLRNSRYCSNCATYGHLTRACPAKPSLFYTEPAYLEQLISAENLKEFNITSKTEIPYRERGEVQQLLEIKDNDQVIATYLSSQSVKVPKGCTKRSTLEKYAMLHNKRLIYLK